MFQRILLPVDGTSGSETAIPYAIDLAKALDAEILVCHAVTTPAGTSASHTRKAAAQYVADIASRFRAASVAVRTRVRDGNPPVVIRKTAVEWEVDAIVMATRSRERVQKLMLGSVADQVVRDSHLPVLLVSSRYEQKHRLAA